MPYIDDEKRPWYNSHIAGIVDTLDQVRSNPALSDGYITDDLDYVVYKILADLFRKNPKYKQGSSLHAAVIDAAHEFKRRHLDPHEDKAIMRNGDI